MIYLMVLTNLLFLILCHKLGLASKVVSWTYCCCSGVTCSATVTCCSSSTGVSCTSSTGVGIDFKASATSIPI